MQKIFSITGNNAGESALCGNVLLHLQYALGLRKKQKQQKKVAFISKNSAKKSEIFARIKGKTYKDDRTVPVTHLRYVHTLCKSLDGSTHEGEMVCNKYIADDLLEIFRKLYEADYPIERMVLIDVYDAD